MGQKKTRYTLDEHRTLGRELCAIRNHVGDVWVDMNHHYPVNAKVVRLSKALGKAIEKLQNELDNLVFEEHKDQEEPQIPLSRCYYLGKEGHSLGIEVVDNKGMEEKQ